MTTYDAPRRPWTDIAASEVAAGRPIPASLLIALWNDSVHTHDIIVGTGDYTGTVPHSHQGAEDAPIAPARGFNLLINSAPTGGDDIHDTVKLWEYDKKVTAATESGWQFNGVEGATVSQYLVFRKGTESAELDLSKAIHGSDGQHCVSLYAKLAGGTPTKGMLSFGISDGSSQFLPGCEAIVHYSDLSASSWVRFYAFMTASDVRDGAKFIIVQSEQSDASTYATATMVSPGHRLHYWRPCRIDKNRNGDDHVYWTGFGFGDCPVFETATAITNAVRLYPV